MGNEISSDPTTANLVSPSLIQTTEKGRQQQNNKQLLGTPATGATTAAEASGASPESTDGMSKSPGALKKDGLASALSPHHITPGMFIQQQTGVFSDRYRGLKILGKGSFGEVVLCQDKVVGSECAVKVISKKNLKKGTDSSALLREVELLRELDHPNIMKLYEFFEDNGYFYLVCEAYTGGELFDAIIDQKKFSEVDAAKIITQVLSGITYMHKHGIVHRDLKPENLLLENKKRDALVKIIDFGLSTHFEAAAGTKMKDKIGTAYYIAPEVLHGTYDEKCDVWSAGVILYILLSGCPPFFGNTEYEILKRVETGKFTFNLPQWRKVSDAAKDLIRRMLFYVPSMRITAQQALEHEWIKTMSATDMVPQDLPFLEQSMLNMRQFQATQKLAKAALLYMGSKLTTAEETNALTKIFRRLDKNGDGQLDRTELMEGYKELMKMKGVDINKLDEQAVEAEVDLVLQTVDFDQNGFLDYSEFVTVAMDRKSLLSAERLKRAFQMFDIDSSGKISSEEVAKLFQFGNVDMDEALQLVKDIDINNDGEIDFEEFVGMLKQLGLSEADSP